MAPRPDLVVTPNARELFAATVDWARPWWDPDVHMVWNPPGSMDEYVPERTFHLVPNTAWLAYAMLHEPTQSTPWHEALRAIEALIALQYDEPHTVFHGTYAQFLESPAPPVAPRMWVDYDPNWRQFVGTTFALMLEDFETDLPEALAARIEHSIGLAVDGEPDGRIPVHYTNPALMRAWLDAWYGNRTGDATLVERGETFARAIVDRYDRYGAFDEFNSPTYSGIDLYALGLWSEFPPTSTYAEAGARIARSLWAQAERFYNPALRNWCGPYTRSYHPDATRSVTLLGVWWALRVGVSEAPLPSLDDEEIDHCHDLMAGPVIARLAAAVPTAPISTNGQEHAPIVVHLADDRTVEASIGTELMVGVESSANDWGGWSQFMPLVVHWAGAHGATDIGVLWLHAPHRVALRFDGSTLSVDASTSQVEFRVSGPAPAMRGNTVRLGRLVATVDGDVEVRSGARDRDIATWTVHGRDGAGSVSFRVHLDLLDLLDLR